MPGIMAYFSAREYWNRSDYVADTTTAGVAHPRASARICAALAATRVQPAPQAQRPPRDRHPARTHRPAARKNSRRTPAPRASPFLAKVAKQFRAQTTSAPTPPRARSPRSRVLPRRRIQELRASNHSRKMRAKDRHPEKPPMPNADRRRSPRNCSTNIDRNEKRLCPRAEFASRALYLCPLPTKSCPAIRACRKSAGPPGESSHIRLLLRSNVREPSRAVASRTQNTALVLPARCAQFRINGRLRRTPRSAAISQAGLDNRSRTRSDNALPSTVLPSSFARAALITAPICLAEFAPVSAIAAAMALSNSASLAPAGK